jgi:hypothetical protein
MKNFFYRQPRTAAMLAIVAFVLICLTVFVIANPQVLGGLHFGGACVWQDSVRYCR